MRVVIAGGKLQGAEAAYLAGKAGWETVVVDRHASVPAAGLADRFLTADLTVSEVARRIVEMGDLVIPAIEDAAILQVLSRAAEAAGVPLAYDPAGYAVSSSKQASNRLFRELGLDLPLPWPDSGFPVIVKPDGASGSLGVGVASDQMELDALLDGKGPGDNQVLQEFVPGPSYSLEIVGCRGQYHPLQVTDLFMDPGFDCKRVCAPTILPPALISDFENIAVRIAAAMGLTGIMDVEAILSGIRLKLLEIDARLPSQTPTAVFWSTGLNMLELLKAIYIDGRLPEPGAVVPKAVIFEHIRVGRGYLEVLGEHIMSAAGPLEVKRGFFGADEALTNYRPGASSFAATLIHRADDMPAAMDKRAETFRAFKRDLNLERIIDLEPGSEEGRS